MSTTTAKTKAETKANAAEKAVEAGKEQLEQAMKAGTEAATKNFEQGFEMARKQMDEAMKGFDQLSVFSKENVEAMIASTNAAMKGFETLNAELLSFSKKSMEDSVAAVKALSSAKNVREYVDIQNSLAKDSYDNFVTEASRVSEVAMKLTNDVFEPISGRVSVATETFVRPSAR